MEQILPVPSDSDEDGQALKIPYAIYRRKGGLSPDVRLVTPIQAKVEALHRSRGFFFCQLCHGELDPRLERRIRTAYFAHRPGQGEDCDRRSGATETYASELRSDWQHELQSRARTMPLVLSLIPRSKDIMIRGSGSVLSAGEFARQMAQAPQGPTVQGLEGTFATAQLAWTRGEFQTKVVDPHSAKIEWVSPLQRFSWAPRISPDERIGSFVVFVGSTSGVAVQPSDMSGVPEALWIVYRSPGERGMVLPVGLKRVLQEGGLSLEPTALGPLPVSGASQWYAVKPKWDWAKGDPRRFLRSARIHIGVRRRVMNVVALDGEARSTSDATSIASTEGRARLLITPEILGQLVVELVPLPFDSHAITRQKISSRGRILQVSLADRERVGEFYVLGLDPLDNARFLLAHRVSVIRGRELEEASASEFDLGVRIVGVGLDRMLNPLAREEVVIDFRRLVRLEGESRLNVELVVPPRASDEEYVHPPIEVKSYKSLAFPPEIIAREEIAEAGRLTTVIELMARDDQTVAIGFRFGLLGECRIVRERGVSPGKFRLRLDIARRIWAEYEGAYRLSAAKRAAIIASLVPEEGVRHGWDSEINHMHKILRMNGGRSASSAEAIAAHIISKGLPEGPIPDLSDDEIGLWIGLLLKSREGQ